MYFTYYEYKVLFEQKKNINYGCLRSRVSYGLEKKKLNKYLFLLFLIFYILNYLLTILLTEKLISNVVYSNYLER